MSSEELTVDNAEGVNRRDFLYVATAGWAAVGTAFAVWPFIAQMAPSADVKAMATVEVDLSRIPEGSEIKVMWQGKPLFIRHRTAEEIEQARSVDLSELPDPEPDSDRAIKPEYLVMIGVCTHLGCIPNAESGDYGGWFCPCHGSHYDIAGRIRKGPAPRNLDLPPYKYTDDTTIIVG
ncbi:ubiquinol-cytochrome c reductase iron-sulfur subunit [Rhodothalassium salexigens DSM 2132]|uniref:Ubiquinol-cytochrome c reductase iron-sulfur subunit n=1 Tax=Rhodothalassium salexigens DSM 2132 TaxID=1188247 RepID=A0A4R2PQM4_RHOSA|nr:ubiquinol-cytochrome c reductase iron-sulfur subunit [Rhodothalassium salexigens]MBB4210446.1 ubiquinol-cytochrome c reductase iron-sulfur subunit [Rhodothalassium salexigens DSM 2132]MBK1638230.1 ubiquinol-cytochrome c reductase iron-sulfur subunit [Rhodothalassium salexigens DSM 2132]TCP37997.1 ubiquinol-cytochrome c reductase iron-sulfur subunit [Rhodothalassium salexigens DSM 2132]